MGWIKKVGGERASEKEERQGTSALYPQERGDKRSIRMNEICFSRGVQGGQKSMKQGHTRGSRGKEEKKHSLKTIYI